MIIVTGGAGFIGSSVIWELNKLGHEDIVIVDNLRDGVKWKNLRALKYADYFEKDDFIEHLMNHSFPFIISKIVHMGACSSPAQNDATYLVKNNYEFTKILADYSIDNGIRFIYASSAATYGEGENGFLDDESSIDKLRPLNMYGYSKQMFDLYAKRKGYFDKIIGLKFFNVFGPNEYHKKDMTSKVYKAFHEINETGEIRLFKSENKNWKDGDSVRDFIYIKDVVKIIISFINKDIIVNGLFNVGTGVSRSWNDLANAVIKNMGKGEISFIDMPKSLIDKYQYYTESNNEKLLSVLEEIEFTTLEDAIEDYVSNYLLLDNYLGD